RDRRLQCHGLCVIPGLIVGGHGSKSDTVCDKVTTRIRRYFINDCRWQGRSGGKGAEQREWSPHTDSLRPGDTSGSPAP
ncbi:MAG: hypothetical protein AAF773_18770, partial [Cyanobacteria bacterium P01_D01_bin.115]